MTEIQKKMHYAVGHKVKVVIFKHIETVFADNTCIGKCVGFTQPLDNDPEVATIEIESDSAAFLYSLEEEIIESIALLD